MTMPKKTAKLLPESYKPTQKELAEDLRIDANPTDVASAVAGPVNVIEKSVSEHRKGRR